jgi:hypothetical protein
MLSQVAGQSDLLLGAEVVAMPAHQRQQATILRSFGIQLSPAGQEVLIHQTDDMEAVGNDPGVRESVSERWLDR